jgi:hypothetical protein
MEVRQLDSKAHQSLSIVSAHAIVLSFLLLASCSPMRGCAESEFALAPESRLPRWFAAESNLARSEVVLKMTYYTSPLGSTARFVLTNRDGRRLSEVEGRIRDGQPLTLGQDSGAGALPYPNYAVVTIDGITEVIEHRRMESVFYITDDAALREQLGVDSR